MPYRLSDDGLSVMVQKNGKWRVLKKHPSRKAAKKHLAALAINVEHK